MKKKRLTILLLTISLCLSVSVFAETIILKSGKTIDGKIIERTDKYVKIDFYGVPLTYFLDEIDKVEGETQKALPTEQSDNKKTEISTQVDIRKQFYPSGKLWEEGFYKNGKEEKWREYYESGNLKSERFYKNGVIDGISKEYYKDGAVRFEWLHKDGKLDGVRKGYYENGAVESEWPYKDGKLNGIMKSYDEKGNVQSEKAYRDGMPIDSEKLYDVKGNVVREISVMEKHPQESKIKISSPRDGSVFHPGDSVAVAVEAPQEISMMLIDAGEYGSNFLDKPPFQLNFTIPFDATPGSFSIGAGGRDDKGNAFGSDEISVSIAK